MYVIILYIKINKCAVQVTSKFVHYRETTQLTSVKPYQYANRNYSMQHLYKSQF
jgi:hypothetical protein